MGRYCAWCIKGGEECGYISPAIDLAKRVWSELKDVPGLGALRNDTAVAFEGYQRINTGYALCDESEPLLHTAGFANLCVQV